MPRAWQPASRGRGLSASLARRAGLTSALASDLLVCSGSPPAPSYAAPIAAALRSGAPAGCSAAPLAVYARAHPSPPGTSPYSSAAVSRTVRTMGRTGLPLPIAWGRVREELEAERGGPSAAVALHLGDTTFVIVHDSLRPPLDCAGFRAVYAWATSADGPAFRPRP